MIKKEDIKVGLRFYITRNDCLKCNFGPIGIQDGNTPILFNAERNDADVYICTSVSTDYKYVARFREEDIMMFGTKFDIVTKGEGVAANGKTEQVSTHPIMRGLRIYVVLSLWIFADTLTSIQGTLSSISCARIRWMATKQRPRSASRTCVRRCFISRTK